MFSSTASLAKTLGGGISLPGRSIEYFPDRKSIGATFGYSTCVEEEAIVFPSSNSGRSRIRGTLSLGRKEGIYGGVDWLLTRDKKEERDPLPLAM